MSRIQNRSIFVLAAAVASFAAGVASAEKLEQKTFKDPEAAGVAVVAAAKADDNAELVTIFGPDSEDLISSGDPVADKSRREKFVAGYDAKHEWNAAPDDEQILSIGTTNWPFPIPLVETEDGWRFDTQRGAEEILNRRIGRNELGAIQASLAFVDAQREYYEREPMGPPARYAQFIASSEGKKDGLYWPVAEGDPESPLGPVFAAARAEGYDPKQGPGAPFHGYIFRVLTKQGDDAFGGEMDYVVDGKMTKGFGLLAWPAKYGASGVMTFLVNQTGVLYEKDLGPETAEAATLLDAFDPDESWDVVSAEARTPPDGES